MAIEKIILVSSDGEQFELETPAAELSAFLKGMIEDECASGPVPLININSFTLSKVTQYCIATVAGGGGSKALRPPNNEFLSQVRDDTPLLLDLIRAAEFLDIECLNRLMCKEVADQIRGKSAEEIRQLLDIENDFTEEEENAIREQHPWYFPKPPSDKQ